jgi:hypothetical protein
MQHALREERWIHDFGRETWGESRLEDGRGYGRIIFKWIFN